ncbi:MAG: hypothetical protein ACI9OE_001567 [Mariniflexile sp.]|jgi:hypothetical protein
MKNVFILLVLFSAFLSCKNEVKTASQDGELTLLKGDFIFFEGAAILQTQTEIYGVLITDKMQELNKLAENYKNLPTDMIPVEIKGKITNKKDNKILWENKVEIIEILNVMQPTPENSNVVKLGQE